MTYGPGIHTMRDDVYHADPVEGGSLSSSGARTLLDKTPARYKAERDNPPASTAVFDLGKAAHSLVLGSGAAPVVVGDGRTKEGKEQRAAALTNGMIPLSQADVERVARMAESLRQHPVAARLLDPAHGLPEQTIIWQDADSGIMRRARLDWLPDAGAGRLIIPDYKTAASANPEHFARSTANFGYHIQDAWYCDAVAAVGLDDEPAFVFVVQEKEPPFLVNVIELDTVARTIGRNLGRKAIGIYADCVRTDTWPGYPSGVELVALPNWYERAHLEETY